MFEIVNGHTHTRTHGRRLESYPINHLVSLRLRWAYNLIVYGNRDHRPPGPSSSVICYGNYLTLVIMIVIFPVPVMPLCSHGLIIRVVTVVLPIFPVSLWPILIFFLIYDVMRSSVIISVFSFIPFPPFVIRVCVIPWITFAILGVFVSHILYILLCFVYHPRDIIQVKQGTFNIFCQFAGPASRQVNSISVQNSSLRFSPLEQIPIISHRYMFLSSQLLFNKAVCLLRLGVNVRLWSW